VTEGREHNSIAQESENNLDGLRHEYGLLAAEWMDLEPFQAVVDELLENGLPQDVRSDFAQFELERSQIQARRQAILKRKDEIERQILAAYANRQ
jgi:hypothetical protein